MTQVKLNEKALHKLIAESIVKILKEERSEDVDNRIIDLISFLHNAQKPVREIHWNTDKYALHMVTDESIDELCSWEDSLAETFISGKDIKLLINETKPSSNEDYKTIMEELINLASEIKEKISDNKDYDNICAVVDEILETSNQLIYKAQLN